MSTAPLVFDRELLVRRRERAAGHGNVSAHAFLLARAVDDLIERLELVRRMFDTVAVLGAHHGLLGRHLRGMASVGTVVELERSPRLAALCDGPVVVGDEELLPFAPASLDLVVSALSLQWANDLPGILAQARAVLKPDGLFLVNVVGGRTLWELRQCFIEAEAERHSGAGPRVAPFLDVRDAGALLQRADLKLPVTDVETLTVAYASAFDLINDLKAMGATNILVDRPRTFLARSVLMRMAEIYSSRFAREDGRVVATFEIVTLTGWAAHGSQQQPLAPGSARISLADVLQRRRPGDDQG
jgi:SAM-dependent methyltransferase